jgi:hypothetical protein
MAYKYRPDARVDSNQSDIVEKLIEAGLTVETGKDDILVGLLGVFNIWLEIKGKSTRKKDGIFRKGTFKKSQVDLQKTWEGQYDVATDEIEAIEAIQKVLNYVNILAESGELKRVNSNLEKIKNGWKK